MRNIPDDILAVIASTEGIEPINIVRVFWTDNGYIDYADKEFEGVQAKLLRLSDVEEIINLDLNASSTNMSLTLDDSDGSLKEIFDNTDIHSRHVKVYQWFTEVAYTSKFVIFEGVISTPITWSESDRTLSFDILSKLEDVEVGFAADEGEFTYVPANIVGKSWPLVFGTVNSLPALRLSDIVSGLLAEELGTVNRGLLDLKNGFNAKNAAALRDEAYNAWLLALSAYATAQKYEDLEILSRQDGTNLDYTSLIDQFTTMGDDYVKQSNTFLQEYQKAITVSVEDAFNEKERLRIQKYDVAVANAHKFAQRQVGEFVIDGQSYQGYFDNSRFYITERPTFSTGSYIPAGITTVTDNAQYVKYQTPLPPDTFIYAGGGAFVQAGKNFPVTYIVAIGWVTVIAVQSEYAKLLTGVPPKYYYVEHVQSGSFKWTRLITYKPMSTVNQNWSDDLYITMTGEVGSSMVDVMVWLIQTYTNYTYDPDSFGLVKYYTDPYPVNFAVTSRPHLFQLLQEIAYQSRCAIWFKDGIFYMKYLPVNATPIETVTADDVDLGSLEISYTDSEERVTKYIADWKQNAYYTRPNQVIFRNNISKYGTRLREYNYYTFNDQRLVEKSAEYWMIRMSNTWKKLTFRTSLHKLKIETWDVITIDGLFVADVPVNCIVESSKYDTTTAKLIISVWVPVRAGEMLPYAFAYPGDLPIEYIYPLLDPYVGNPVTQLPGGTLYQQNLGDVQIPVTRPRMDRGRGGAIGDVGDRNLDYSVQVQLDSREILTGSTPAFQSTSVGQYTIKPVAQPAFTTTENNGTFFGTVKSQVAGNKYNVLAFLKGVDSEPQLIQVDQFSIKTGELIPPETPVIVYQTTQAVSQADGTKTYLRAYRMQVPVWVANANV